MSHRINDIKSQLTGGGARPSLFHVSMDLPANLNVAPEFASSSTNGARFGEKMKFLCSAASLPASTLSQIDVPYQGRKIKVAGSRSFADWEVTIINDEDFLVYRSFMAWSHAINTHETNLRDYGVTSNPASYKVDARVKQYAKDNDTSPIYQVKFEGLWPVSVSNITLDWSQENQIETFNVTFAYDLWVPDNTQE